MPRGRPRKTRVTTEQVRSIIEDNKKTTYERKKKIIPGPWTNIETKLTVEAQLRFNNTGVMAQILGSSYGSYTNDTHWTEKSWYPIVINVELPNLKELMITPGPKELLAAIEKSLNQKDPNGKSKYGTIILLSLGADNSQHPDPEKRFISLKAKTNKKNIVGFRAIRQNELTTIKSDQITDDTNEQITESII